MNVSSQSWKDFGELAYCSLRLSQRECDTKQKGSTTATRNPKWRTKSHSANSLNVSATDSMRVALLSNTHSVRLEDSLHEKQLQIPGEPFTSEVAFLRQQNSFYIDKCERLQELLNISERQSNNTLDGNEEVKTEDKSETGRSEKEQFYQALLDELNFKLLKEAALVCKLERQLAEVNAKLDLKDREMFALKERMFEEAEDKQRLIRALENERARFRQLELEGKRDKSNTQQELIHSIENEMQQVESAREAIDVDVVALEAEAIFAKREFTEMHLAELIHEIEQLFRSKAFSVVFGTVFPDNLAFADIAQRIRGLYDEEKMEKALNYGLFDLPHAEMLVIIRWVLFMRFHVQ